MHGKLIVIAVLLFKCIVWANMDSVPLFDFIEYSNKEGFKAFLAGDDRFKRFADTSSYSKDLNNDGFADTVFVTKFKMIEGFGSLDKNVRIVNGKTKEEYSLNYNWNNYDIVSFSPLSDNLVKEHNAPFLNEICKAIAFDVFDSSYYKRQNADPSLEWLLSNYGLDEKQKSVKLNLSWHDSVSADPRSYYIVMDTSELNKYGLKISELIGENMHLPSKMVLFYNKNYLYSYNEDPKPIISKNHAIYKMRGNIYIKNEKGISYLFVSNHVPLNISFLSDIELISGRLYFQQQLYGLDSNRLYRLNIDTGILEFLNLDTLSVVDKIAKTNSSNSKTDSDIEREKTLEYFFLFLFIAFCLFIAGYSIKLDYSLIKNSEYVDAIIYELTICKGYGKRSRSMECLKYIYIVDGVKHKGAGYWYSKKDNLSLGDIIKIVYDKTNPSYSKPKRDFERKWWR